MGEGDAAATLISWPPRLRCANVFQLQGRHTAAAGTGGR